MGNMNRTPSLISVSTRLQQIAKLARQMPQAALSTLSHHIDLEFLCEAYRRTRKDGATGVDEMTAKELRASSMSIWPRCWSGSNQGRTGLRPCDEEEAVHYPDGGTPQGGVISPLLANIYLHHVLDTWVPRHGEAEASRRSVSGPLCRRLRDRVRDEE